MNIIIVDISGTVEEYSRYLAQSISESCCSNDEVHLLCPNSNTCIRSCHTVFSVSLVPTKFKRTTAIWKRFLKVAEVILNYLSLFVFICFHKVDILHFQWFPFLSIFPFEKYYLILIKKICPSLKIIYTLHNVYPHNSTAKAMSVYRRRFKDIIDNIDHVIVHTNTTKCEAIKEFEIFEDKIHVCYHGVFYPTNDYSTIRSFDDKKKILMYGMQEEYKGTDILIMAISLLPQEDRSKVSVKIMGKTIPSYYKAHIAEAQKNDIEWIPNRISDRELYSSISSSDILVFPYRNISQSGALLLGLYFNKYIIASNLPSFIETLEGYDKDWFFQSEDAYSLSKLISNHINKKIDYKKMNEINKYLQKKYSWENVAKNTLVVYTE